MSHNDACIFVRNCYMAGHYLQEHKHILIVGPTDTGKSHCAQALGHQACRQGKRVRFIRSALLLREMNASRADQTWDRALKRFIAPDLLIIDDFGLSALTFSQAEAIYELIAERHHKSSLIFTSHRKSKLGWISFLILLWEMQRLIGSSVKVTPLSWKVSLIDARGNLNFIHNKMRRQT